MLHYDDSSRDDWAVEWFHDPRCTNGYTWLVLDDGRVVELADPAMRTPHAGPCLTPNANSAFYGIAAATNGLVPATEAQLVVDHRHFASPCAVSRLAGRGRCHAHRGPRRASHLDPGLHLAARALGPSRPEGRPAGQRPDGSPIIDLADVRRRVRDAL